MRRLFVLVLVASAGFVQYTSRSLPPVVASHFGPGGTANAYMGKGHYTALMIAVVVTVPLVISAFSLLVRLIPPQFVNLPNKEYWLAPERRAASLEALASLSVGFAGALAVFLAFVHWLVVRANSVQPAQLPEAWLFVGLALFAVATLGWLFSILRRFDRVP